MPKKNTGKKEEQLLVGIDLGTSRSAVSASNGKKKWVQSYVGWPKDFIAKKAVGAPVLFGEEVLEHRLSLDLYRPLKNGVIKEGSTRDEDAVKELVNHLISLVRPQSDSNRIRAVIGVPAESFAVSKNALKKSVGDYVESIVVVSEPFAVAYGIGEIDNAMVVDIGAGTVDFCIMHGTMPSEENQRTVLTAGDYIDKQLSKALEDKYPESDFTISMVRRFKEQFSFVGEPDKAIKVDIPVKGKPTKHEITDEMKRSCESILPAITETMLEMIASYDPEFQDKIRKNIILAGAGSQIVGLADYLEDVLDEYSDSNVRVIDDPLYGGSDGALALANDLPEEYWEDV